MNTYEMEIRELIDRLFTNAHTTEEKIDIITLLQRIFVKSSHNSNEFYKASKNVIEEVCIKENICPQCFLELSTHEWIEPRGENIYETMFEWYCPNCG